MSKFKFYKIVVLFILCAIGIFYYLQPHEGIDYRKHIEKYLALLDEDPINCIYLEQIANSYQALNNFHESINYYKRVLEYCPNNLISLFQLGVSYYLIMDREKGLKYMDEAIERAKKMSEKELEKIFMADKTSWIEKWDLVKEMEWNKKKNAN